MSTYFISDLHLSPKRPDIALAFMHLIKTLPSDTDRLYILGDLFEYWIGDDAANTVGAQSILDTLAEVGQTHDCYFIAGNRDFLVGEQFCTHTGFTLLPDESIIDLYDTPTLILHGDSLCTDDIAHQQFRQQMMTNEAFKKQFLSLSIEQRIEQAQKARQMSMQHKQSVSMEIMDVNPQAVLDAFNKHNVQQMIHGHTHRQNTHKYKANTLTRWVLGDWDKTSSVLIANKDSLTIENQPI